MAGQFQKYSQFYDRIYQGKDYSSEVTYVDKILRQNTHKRSKTMLSLGCGTGTYEILLAKKGYQIDGVDLSATMLAEARRKVANARLNRAINLHQGDIRRFRLAKKFNVAVMLFNIIGYMNSNQDLERALQNVSAHLETGGLFAFDCWYTPAVLRDPPTDRVKEIKDRKQRLIRITKSQLLWHQNLVDINFQVLSIKGSQVSAEVSENHPMRYFSLPELEYFLQKNGLELVKTYDWLETKPSVSGRKWDIFVVARKI